MLQFLHDSVRIVADDRIAYATGRRGDEAYRNLHRRLAASKIALHSEKELKTDATRVQNTLRPALRVEPVEAQAAADGHRGLETQREERQPQRPARRLEAQPARRVEAPKHQADPTQRLDEEQQSHRPAPGAG